MNEQEKEPPRDAAPAPGAASDAPPDAAPEEQVEGSRGPVLAEPLRILHQDAALVAVSKPGGMRVHRDAWSKAGERYVLQTLSRQIDRYLFPVHRLDAATSGVLVFGLTPESTRVLAAIFAEGRARKGYLVLVRNETPARFRSERALTGSDKTRKPSRTDFRRLATFSRCSLLLARPRTGRMHQIRRHLGHLAHQVIGDSSYGKGRINAFFRETYGLPRMFLHARRLVIPHPETGAPLVLRDPLADDLRAFLKRLPDCDPALIARL